MARHARSGAACLACGIDVLVRPAEPADVPAHSVDDEAGLLVLAVARGGLWPDCRALSGNDDRRPQVRTEAVTAKPAPRQLFWIGAALLLFLFLEGAAAFAHDISQADRAAVAQIEGPAPFAFLYLGAKHMVTGIDHILFLIGVVFFLHKLRDVIVYVSLFTLGHSLTLLGGVLLNTGANSYIVDAIIGF